MAAAQQTAAHQTTAHQTGSVVSNNSRRQFYNLDQLLSFLSEYEETTCTKFIHQKSFVNYRKTLEDLAFGK